MNSILLLVGVAFIFASVNSFPATTGSLLTPTVTKFCALVSVKTQIAELYYVQTLTTLRQFGNIQQFAPQTIAYLRNEKNKQQLLAGGDSCQQYFVDLKAAMQNDGQTNRLTAQDIQQKIDQLVDQSLDKLGSILNLIKG